VDPDPRPVAFDEPARGILAEGRQLHVAVLTTRGPHVTPELYAVAGDDLWFATAATTLKTRVIRRDPRVSAVVRAGSRSLVVVGEATHYDVADPLRLVGQARDGWRALQAVTAFTMRNAADLGSFARDLALGRLPTRRPPRRVLVRLRPTAWARLDAAGVEAAGGDWPGSIDVPGAPAPLDGQRDAIVGWEVPAGVLALPARTAPSTDKATVPAAVARLAQVTAGQPTAACVVVDDYRSPGPAAKRGTLLRGTGTLRYDGSLGRIDLEVERETVWDGVHTRTRDASAS
jgi:hypothetical protein